MQLWCVFLFFTPTAGTVDTNLWQSRQYIYVKICWCIFKHRNKPTQNYKGYSKTSIKQQTRSQISIWRVYILFCSNESEVSKIKSCRILLNTEVRSVTTIHCLHSGRKRKKSLRPKLKIKSLWKRIRNVLRGEDDKEKKVDIWR